MFLSRIQAAIEAPLARGAAWLVAPAALAARLYVAWAFLHSGWLKASDMHGTVGFFHSVGFGPFWAYLVTAVELFGGIAVLLGIYTRVAAKLLAIVMIVAMYLLRGNMEMAMLPFLMFFATVSLTLSGGGKYSLMKKLCKSEASALLS